MGERRDTLRWQLGDATIERVEARRGAVEDVERSTCVTVPGQASPPPRRSIEGVVNRQ